MKHLSTTDKRLLLLALTCLIGFIVLYPNLYSVSNIHFGLDKAEILEKAEKYVHSWGYLTSKSTPSIHFTDDIDQIRHLQKSYGTRLANQYMKDSLDVFFWEIIWDIDTDQDPDGVTLEYNNAHRRSDEATQIRMGIDLKGNPLFLQTSQFGNLQSDSTLNNHLLFSSDSIQVHNLAKSLLHGEFSQWFLDTLHIPQNPEESWRYIWKKKIQVAKQDAFIEIQTQSGQITGFQKIYQGALAPPVSDSKNDLYDTLSFFVIYLFFIILGGIFFISRLRSDKLDLKSGLIPALFVLAGWCITYWIQNPGQELAELIIGFLITIPFVAGGLWIMFIIGESYTRETWPDKLNVYDNLRRYLLFPELGVSMLRGFALAAIGIGGLSLLSYIFINIFNSYSLTHEITMYFWSRPLPSVYALGLSLLRAVYISVSFCLFFTSFLKQKIRNKQLFWVILFVFWAFISLPLPQIMPYWSKMSLNGLLGILITVFFIRYNFMTAVVGAISIPILFYATGALYSENTAFIIHGFVLLSVIIVLVLIALKALRGNISIENIAPYVPDYMQRIYEKERIHRELEIARNVQVNFLPRSTPEIPELDIAVVCVPAREVGGDYYDFIQLTPNKLGIAIGDVSGKGISAAFYMTLTKGFLQSQARSYSSPREVLMHLNELFYENSDREVFISMIYGIFDVSAKTLTFARAGHNPMIAWRKKDGKLLNFAPPGIALGLESGDLFDSTIQEEVLSFEPDDLFLFYTDGLNEAQNQFKEEFGEDRLENAVDAHKHLSSKELVHTVHENIQEFTGHVLQHDDMTVLAVKITS